MNLSHDDHDQPRTLADAATALGVPQREARALAMHAATLAGLRFHERDGLTVAVFPYLGEERAPSTPKRAAQATTPTEDDGGEDADPEPAAEDEHEDAASPVGLSLSYSDRAKERDEPWRTIMREARGIFRRRGPARAPKADEEDTGQYVALATWAQWGADVTAEKAKAYARGVAEKTTLDYRMQKRRKRDYLREPFIGVPFADYLATYDAERCREEATGTIPPVDAEPLGLESESPVAYVERLARRGVLAEDLILTMIDRERHPEGTYWSDVRLLAEVEYCEKKNVRRLPAVPKKDFETVAGIEPSPTLAALLMLALGYRPEDVEIGTDLHEVKRPVVELFKKRKARAAKKSTGVSSIVPAREAAQWT